MKVKVGERWIGSDRKFFMVISVMEQNGNIWVHYRDDTGKEYSCWEDSFVHRFTKDGTFDANRYI